MPRFTEEELTEVLNNPDVKVVSDNLPARQSKPSLAHSLGTKHKYNAVRTEYNGKSYPSKKEAKHAEENNLRIKAGDLSFYLEQVPIRLPGKITYRVDFVEFTRVSCYYEVHWIEVKGYRTPVGELKRKQAEAILGIKIEVV